MTTVPTNATLEADTSRPVAPRRLALDVARGVAVLAMVVYHTAWDLWQLQLVATDVQDHPVWFVFARTIAASFLFISGIGLVLAHGAGIRWSQFGRRIAILGAAALVVTIGTRIAFPDSYIFFGILHNLAVSSLVGLLFVRLPPAMTGIAGLGMVVAGYMVRSDALNAPILGFVGLGTQVPFTNDWVPVLPWTGYVVMGVAAGRLGLGRTKPNATSEAPSRALTTLAAIGRRSLAIYLIHQPLIFGALFGLRQLVGPNPAAEAEPFMRSCAGSCEASRVASGLSSDRESRSCRIVCGCTVDALKRDMLWTAILSGTPKPDEMSRASQLFTICLRGAP